MSFRFLLTKEINNSMEHSISWEARSHSASQEIPHLLWNPKVHHIYKIPLLILILSDMKAVQNLPLNFPKIHFNIILPPTLRPSNRILNAPLISPSCAKCPTHLNLLVTCGEQYKLWSSSLYNFLQTPCYFLPLTSKCFSQILFSNFLTYIIHLKWETMFHTHTNNR